MSHIDSRQFIWCQRGSGGTMLHIDSIKIYSGYS